MALTIGRTVGFAITFAIPLVLARALTQEEFGIYKYVFLIAATLGVTQFGMAESLYYFIPRDQQAAGRAIANALAILVVIGALVWGVFASYADVIAGWTGNATVAPYLPAVGLFIALSLVSTPLEIVLTSRQQYRGAAIVYALSDATRAAALIVPGLWFGNIPALLTGAVIFGLFRCVLLAVYLARSLGATLRPDRQLLWIQLAYAVPFAAAVIIEAIQINLHQYVVWARFDAAAFAIYAAGCLQIPLVDLLATSVANVMMVRMADERVTPAAALTTWRAAVERLAFVFVPLCVALMLVAHDVIVVLFTAAYAASVPIFIVGTSAILLAILPVDAVLRVYAQTRFLIVMNVVRLLVVASTIGVAIGVFGLPGAIAATVMSTFVAKSLAVRRIAGLFGASVSEILPWRALGRTVTTAAVSVIPALVLNEAMSAPPLLRAACVTAIFAATYLAISLRWSAGHFAVGRRLGWNTGAPPR